MQSEQAQQQQAPAQQEVRLTEVDVANENVALNVMVGFLNLSQRRGAFNMEESAKVWECVKMFMRREEGGAPSTDAPLPTVDEASEENTVLNA